MPQCEKTFDQPKLIPRFRANNDLDRENCCKYDWCSEKEPVCEHQFNLGLNVVHTLVPPLTFLSGHRIFNSSKLQDFMFLAE